MSASPLLLTKNDEMDGDEVEFEISTNFHTDPAPWRSDEERADESRSLRR